MGTLVTVPTSSAQGFAESLQQGSSNVMRNCCDTAAIVLDTHSKIRNGLGSLAKILKNSVLYDLERLQELCRYCALTDLQRKIYSTCKDLFISIAVISSTVQVPVAIPY